MSSHHGRGLLRNLKSLEEVIFKAGHILNSNLSRVWCSLDHLLMLDHFQAKFSYLEYHFKFLKKSEAIFCEAITIKFYCQILKILSRNNVWSFSINDQVLKLQIPWTEKSLSMHLSDREKCLLTKRNAICTYFKKPFSWKDFKSATACLLKINWQG